MAIMISEDFLPAMFTSGPMTDDEFAAFCAEHPDLSIEMTAEGELLLMAPTYSLTSNQNIEIAWQLQGWAKKDRRGKAFDSSGGFVLPNGARRSPDASWILKSRIAELDRASRKKFWHICPDFVIELRSSSDRLRMVKQKMEEYLANGAQLGWLIDPSEQYVLVYRPGMEPEARVKPASIQGEGPVAGFELDLSEIWTPEEC